MGVPGFFAWLLKNYKQSILTTDVMKVDYLFMDFNCLLHPMCFKTLEEHKDWKNIDKLEELMLDKIIQYLDFIVDFVKPSKCLYIAIDGVCPMTKVKHQRLRRFKSVYDFEYIKQLKLKYGIELTNFWSNASITPGTKFMSKITKRLLNYSETCVKVPKIIFSSARTPAEGEHKIMNFIKKRRFGNDTNLAIYGLDADLIFLSMATNKNNIYLLREYKEISKEITESVETPLVWVIVDSLRDCVKNVFLKEGIEHDNTTKDFIFLCYLLGNDFIPHLPSVSIYDGGIDLLINVYKECYKDMSLLGDKNKVNYDFLTSIFEILSMKENTYFKSQYTKRQYQKPKSDSDFESEMWNYENLRYPFDDPVKLGKDFNWKERYYNYYYGSNERYLVFKACQSYIEGLDWIANYYFDKCVSWHWYYPFEQAPFVSDLYYFLSKNKLRPYRFKLENPIEPVEQLLIVIPPQLKFLLPKSFQKPLVTELKDLSPEIFDIDRINKKKGFEAVPRLKQLDYSRIKKSASSTKKNIYENKVESDVEYLENINIPIKDYVFIHKILK